MQQSFKYGGTIIDYAPKVKIPDDAIITWKIFPHEGLSNKITRPIDHAGILISIEDKRKIAICRTGIHYSLNLAQAARYVSSYCSVTRCKVWGDVKHGNDKLVARHCYIDRYYNFYSVQWALLASTNPNFKVNDYKPTPTLLNDLVNGDDVYKVKILDALIIRRLDFEAFDLVKAQSILEGRG